ncbi:MAG: hypothetical protein O2803_01575 [Chloroflexi bacterium]|nr:hypothetical protein [Chloroflexota bacterium]
MALLLFAISEENDDESECSDGGPIGEPIQPRLNRNAEMKEAV